MSRFQRPEINMPAESDSDPRIGSLITLVDDQKLPDNTEIAIVGFPHSSEDGNEDSNSLNCIREALYQFTPDFRDFKSFVKIARQTIDLGDLVRTGDSSADLALLGKTVKSLRSRGITAVVLGGPPSTTLGHFLGYTAEATDPVTVLSFDGQTGVSDGADETRPFRDIIEHSSGKCRRFHVAGPQTFSTPRKDVDYVNEHVGEVFWADDITPEHLADIFGNLTTGLMCSFDLDVVNQSQAPGVKSPNPQGISAAMWCHAAFDAGRCSKTTSIEFVGLCSERDQNNATARLAALAVWKFIHGFAQRW